MVAHIDELKNTGRTNILYVTLEDRFIQYKKIDIKEIFSSGITSIILDIIAIVSDAFLNLNLTLCVKLYFHFSAHILKLL